MKCEDKCPAFPLTIACFPVVSFIRYGEIIKPEYI